MSIYLKNIPAKFHPDPIWNYGDLRFLEELVPNEKKNKMSSSWIKNEQHVSFSWKFSK